jgi:hypothetical protein
MTYMTCVQQLLHSVLAQPLPDNQVYRAGLQWELMAPFTPRDIYMAAVVGGACIGLFLMGWGVLFFSAAFSAGGTSTSIYPIEGAALFSAGAAFLLVSIILLPAMRAIQLESASQMRGP